MAELFACSHSILQAHSLCSLPRSIISQRPFVSVSEIARIPSIRSETFLHSNRGRVSPEVDWPEDSPNQKSSLSPNKEAILDLFKRIQSSISKGETPSSRKRNIKPNDSNNTPSVESLVEALNTRRGKASSRKGYKPNSQPRDPIKKDEDATQNSPPPKPPSNFTRRSPIPTSTNIEVSTPNLVQEDDEVDDKNSDQILKFEEMNLQQLKEEAKLRGIKGYSRLRKSQLLELFAKSEDGSLSS